VQLVDLSNYYTKEQVAALIDEKIVTQDELTKAEIALAARTLKVIIDEITEKIPFIEVR